MQDHHMVVSVGGTGTTEAANENQQKPANEGTRAPTDIASDGSFHPSPFVPNVNLRLQSIGPTGFTPGAPSLATPGDERWRKENRPKITRKHQVSVKMGEPERELTLFAMRLAVLEKTASNIGTLAFIWATVVLLGGYAVTLTHKDFWFVTVILVIEGARIFSRSHELELQHQDPGTSTLSRAYHKGSDALHRSGRAVRTAISNLVSPGGERRSQFNVSMDQAESQRSDVDFVPKILHRSKSVSSVSLVPFMSWIFRAKYISAFLYSMQLVSAVTSIILSVLRLITHNFIGPDESDTAFNHTSALLIFYGLTILEALIFLLERSYWQYQISIQNILQNVTKRCELPLNDESLYTVKRFFYDVYSKCLTGSVFEGLKMDILDYTLSWLQSDTPSEQLAGVRALSVFSASSDKDFSEEALKTIGTRQAAIERLIEMITWKSIPKEREIRTAAAELLCSLVKFNRNSIRVAAISGSLDGIVSLLSEDKGTEAASTHDTHGCVRRASLEQKNLPAHRLGLRILINLAKNPMNCTKIGETRGLLTRLINLIDADNPALRKYDAETETPKNSILLLALRLLGLLAGASGVPGKTLREEIAKVVVSISNLRGVLNLKHEESSDVLLLQQHAAGTLSSLAMDDNVSEVIGRTGGVIGILFELFRSDTACGNPEKVKVALRAGEALKMLVLKPGKNCERIFRLEVVQQQDESRTDVVEELLKMLDDRERGHLAMCILSSFLKSTHDYSGCKARIVATTLQVMEVVMEERGARQEAAIGLAARTVPLLSKKELAHVFSSYQIVTETGIVARLRTVLDQNHTPSIRFPGIRRFCLDLILALLTVDSASFKPKFLAQQFRLLLRQLAATTSDLENYSTFCNDIGVTFHTVLIEQLFDDAIAKLDPHER